MYAASGISRLDEARPYLCYTLRSYVACTSHCVSTSDLDLTSSHICVTNLMAHLIAHLIVHPCKTYLHYKMHHTFASNAYVTSLHDTHAGQMSVTHPMAFAPIDTDLKRLFCRAHFPPAVSPEEHEALGPHLDALINLLHNHSRQSVTVTHLH